jgi:asparagine synthetase B (glutamine-hydrolysing)
MLTEMKGAWRPGIITHQLDDMGGGVYAEVTGSATTLTLQQSRPGLHPLYYGQIGHYVHWDEWEWRLRRKLRGLGAKKPVVSELHGGEMVTFDGRALHSTLSPIAVPPVQAIHDMEDARDEFATRFTAAVRDIYEGHKGGPVTVLLSGGVDSILTLWALLRIGADVETVTAGRSEDDFDPLWAKRVADHWGVPWHLCRVPTETEALQTLLTRTLGVIEQTSFSNVLMGCCCELIRDRMRETGRKVAYLGFFGDLLFGHKLQVTGSFNLLPEARKTDAAWTEQRITHCWHSKPHSLQLAKGMRFGGETTWRVPFAHREIAPWTFGLPRVAAPPLMDKPLLYGLMDRHLPADVAAWHVQRKIGFYTGAGIGKLRLTNPVLQDENVRRTYAHVKARLS